MDRQQLLNDPEASMRIALEGKQAQIWTALPCIVDSVNWTQMTIECQSAIQGTNEDGDGNVTFVNLPKLVDVPICFPSAGGFTLTLPLKQNDEVLVVIASRCIDAWWQSGGVQKPAEIRFHDLSDGFCIPGPKSLPNVISNISTTTAQLRNNAGSAYIEIDASGNINIKGNLMVTGSITATEEVTGNGVALSTHEHLAGTLEAPNGPVTGETGAPA